MDTTARLLRCWVTASASVPVRRTPYPVPRIYKGHHLGTKSLAGWAN